VARFDVVLFGATGVTGRRAVPYLAARVAELGGSWAVAGRDPQRLFQLTSGLPLAGMPEVLEADLDDPASLEALAASCRVLVNAVGPTRASAPPLVSACIAAGTDYLDLSGELDVVGDLVEDHHAAAVAAGVRIVQCAGFEALPFDLAVAAAADAARDTGSRLVEAEALLSVQLPPGLPRLSDGISAGTFRSLLGVIGAQDTVRALDPACLLPFDADADAVRSASPIGTLPRLRGASIVIPMTPSPFVNPAVIHRTDALGRAEGHGNAVGFRYREGVAVGDGVLSLPFQLALAAPVATAATGLRALAALTPRPVRRGAAEVLGRLEPALRDGPDEDRLEGWRWRLDVRGTDEHGLEHRVVVDADGHPGYLATSRMVAEAALLLADPEAQLPEAAGHLTPAAALGTAELARFDHARVRFRVP
jgi:short subunit dehydrogenase-like uncharacterized protein